VAPLREKLIRLLACLVAIDLAIAVVVIDERAGAEPTAAAAPDAPAAGAGPATGGATATQNGGIFAGAQFKHRRGSVTLSTGTTASAGASSEVAAPPSSTGGSPAATGSPTSTGSTSGSGRPRSTGGSSGSTGGSTGGSAGRSPAPGTSGTAPGGAGADSPAPGGDLTFPSGDGTTSSTSDTTPTTGSGPTGGSPSGGGTTPTTAPGSVQPTGTPPAKGPASLVVTDKTGDVVTDGTGTTMTEGHADIVKVQADWTAKALVFATQVATPVNPAQDPHWASQKTYISWMLDTNGDGKPDFEVQYFFDSKSGLLADVSKAGDTSGNSACPAEAGYTADGYTVAIDPACLGNPASVSFNVTTYYDTDPANANANQATDTAPDSGMSGPVSKP